MSGFPPHVRLLAYARSDQRCEVCGVYAYGGSLHHRRPRGMGGDKRPETNSIASALVLCGSGSTGCHGWIETHRDESLERGLLVSRYDNPAEIPVELRVGRVLLGPFGEYIPTERDA
jgi:5-methylcytosine-specific restriction protein A